MTERKIDIIEKTTAFQGYFRIGKDGTKDIVEVVGDAAC